MILFHAGPGPGRTTARLPSASTAEEGQVAKLQSLLPRSNHGSGAREHNHRLARRIREVQLANAQRRGAAQSQRQLTVFADRGDWPPKAATDRKPGVVGGGLSLVVVGGFCGTLQRRTAPAGGPSVACGRSIANPANRLRGRRSLGRDRRNSPQWSLPASDPLVMMPLRPGFQAGAPAAQPAPAALQHG